MEKGTVKWFDPEKNYGFITKENSTTDYFVHGSNVETLDRVLEKNQLVEFEITEGKRGAQATHVKPLTE